ncbi:hypothetical protein M9H77_21595 [Catharanthus roseus]|uniref:Uncharacterized protein n=1 Tax=Catharanthus roseus TaxID=4058 RepID=A0ACC0AP92_CATRO|nr:hypothetical protein M9H77_21595 [Catharanthus roseus]
MSEYFVSQPFISIDSTPFFQLNKGLILKVEDHQSIGIDQVEEELKESESALECLRASLMEKEIELQNVTAENDMLKLEIKNRELERSKLNDEACALTEAAKATKKEARMKLGYLIEEADKSRRKAARIIKQIKVVERQQEPKHQKHT